MRDVRRPCPGDRIRQSHPDSRIGNGETSPEAIEEDVVPIGRATAGLEQRQPDQALAIGKPTYEVFVKRHAEPTQCRSKCVETEPSRSRPNYKRPTSSDGAGPNLGCAAREAASERLRPDGPRDIARLARTPERTPRRCSPGRTRRPNGRAPEGPPTRSIDPYRTLALDNVPSLFSNERMRSPTRLSNWPWVEVNVDCKLCPRRGRYRLARLAHRFGPELEMLLDHLAADCPWPWDRGGRRPRPYEARCGIRLTDWDRRPPTVDVPTTPNRLRPPKRFRALTVADLPGPTVTVTCEPCRRRGVYHVARLVTRFGAEMPLPTLLSRLANDCPRLREPTPRCQAVYGASPTA